MKNPIFFNPINQPPKQTARPFVNDIAHQKIAPGPAILDLSQKLKRATPSPVSPTTQTLNPSPNWIQNSQTANYNPLPNDLPEPETQGFSQELSNFQPQNIHENPLPLSQKNAIVLGFLFLLAALFLLSFKL